MTETTQPPALPRRTESGMQTRAVNAAAAVLLAAMQQGRQTPTGLAIALDSARLLQSPETATQLTEYERLNPQQCRAGKHADWLVDSEYTHACPWCRIAELEARLAEHDRPADEDPIAYTLTEQAGGA